MDAQKNSTRLILHLKLVRYLCIYTLNPLTLHIFLEINFTRSISLQAKLHSLSYQDKILTRLLFLPRTIVLKPSTIDEGDSPIISDDTSGSSVYAIIPFK